MNPASLPAPGSFRAYLQSVPARLSASTPRQRLQGALLLASGLLLLLLLAVPYDRQALVITVESAEPGQLQVYFDRGSGLSESLSATQAYAAGETELRYRLPRGNIRSLRLDPSPGAAPLVLARIASTGGAQDGVRILADPGQLAGTQIVRDGTDEHGHARFLVAEDANDPQLALALDAPLPSNTGIPPVLWRALWWGFWLCLLGVVALQFLRLSRPMLVLALLALGLCSAMAMFSPTDGRSLHPDERLHEADARYFQRHWTPPRMDAPDLAPSFTTSPYGVTYLSEWNVVYLFAGKASRLFRELGMNEKLSFRAFNVAVFALMLVGLVATGAPRGSYIPLLITPQLWYVFSYFNGDALPFALGMVACVVALMPDGPLQRFLQRRGPFDTATLGHLLLFCTCFGLLLLSKKNYWPVAAFIALSMSVVALRLRAGVVLALVTLLLLGVAANGAGAALAAAVGQGGLGLAGVLAAGALGYCLYSAWTLLREPDSRRGIGRIAIVLTLAAAVALPWISMDAYKHRGGPGKSALVEQQRERYAAPAFKPSVAKDMSELYPGLRLQQKGVTPGGLLEAPRTWHTTSFRSFFGVYGYMEYYDADIVYRAMGWGVCALLLLALGLGLATRTLSIAEVVASAGCAAALVLASFLHSWVYDFQPQGRYVLGILVMMVPFFLRTGESPLARRLFTTAALVVFLLSAASFTRIALPHLT
jgi:hypothetical protein